MASGDVAEREQTQEDHGDATLQQKHAAMLHRLAIKEDARLQKSAARREGSLASENPNESTDRFIEAFSASAKQLEQALSSVHQIVSSEAGRSSASSDLDATAIRISELEQFLAEHSYFLPAYEVRASQCTISMLREKLECINAELLPKKRFSFKSKASKDRKTAEAQFSQPSQPIPPSDMAVAGKVLQSVQDCKGTSMEAAKHSKGSSMSLSCVVRDLKGAVVVRDLKGQDLEVILENLTNCSVYIQGICRAMYAHKLSSCKVYAGPITSSALIEEVEDCTMMLASQQIRIHHAKKIDMYLRVRSRPIVEYTSDVRFAPYAFSYPGIENDLSAASLSEETGLWEQVDDFRWLRAIPSPNWCILPKEERAAPFDGSSL
ncbi:hypothetical protein L7F22_052073 [Adiantum nelumboides]|nr:hypothetical protein [Adiantum nelumboides]